MHARTAPPSMVAPCRNVFCYTATCCNTQVMRRTPRQPHICYRTRQGALARDLCRVSASKQSMTMRDTASRPISTSCTRTTARAMGAQFRCRCGRGEPGTGSTEMDHASTACNRASTACNRVSTACNRVSTTYNRAQQRTALSGETEQSGAAVPEAFDRERPAQADYFRLAVLPRYTCAPHAKEGACCMLYSGRTGKTVSRVSSIRLHAACCELHAACFMLHAVCCMLHAANCTLHVGTLHAACCELHVACFMLHAACCIRAGL